MWSRYSALFIYGFLFFHGGIAAPRDGSGKSGDSEAAYKLLAVTGEHFVPVISILLVIPFLLVVIICCKSRRRQRDKIELENDSSKDFELHENKWTVDTMDKIDIDDIEKGARQWKMSPEKSKINHSSSDISTPLLAATLPLPPPPSPLPAPNSRSLERERSFRRSFKLPVAPPETQQKTIPQIGDPIPAPKIVEIYRQKYAPPNCGPNGEIRLSPFMHRRSPLPMDDKREERLSGILTSSKCQSSSTIMQQSFSPIADHKKKEVGLPMASHLSSTLPSHMQRIESSPSHYLEPDIQTYESHGPTMSKIPFHMLPSKSVLCSFSESVNGSGHRQGSGSLQHAKSLDELLHFTGSESVTVIFDQSQRSKYSRVTITASSDMLDKNMPKESKMTLRRPDNNNNLGNFSEYSNIKGFGQSSSPDAISITSYTLTTKMLEEEELLQNSLNAGENLTSSLGEDFSASHADILEQESMIALEDSSLGQMGECTDKEVEETDNGGGNLDDEIENELEKLEAEEDNAQQVSMRAAENDEKSEGEGKKGEGEGDEEEEKEEEEELEGDDECQSMFEDMSEEGVLEDCEAHSVMFDELDLQVVKIREPGDGWQNEKHQAAEQAEETEALKMNDGISERKNGEMPGSGTGEGPEKDYHDEEGSRVELSEAALHEEIEEKMVTWSIEDNLFEITFREAGYELAEKEEIMGVEEEVDEGVKMEELEEESDVEEEIKEVAKEEMLGIAFEEKVSEDMEIGQKEDDAIPDGQALLREEEVLEKEEIEDMRGEAAELTDGEGATGKIKDEHKDFRGNTLGETKESISNAEVDKDIREKENEEDHFVVEDIEGMETKIKGLQAVDQLHLDESKQGEDSINNVEKNLENVEAQMVTADKVENTKNHEIQYVGNEHVLPHADANSECTQTGVAKKVEMEETELIKDREICTIIVKFEPDTTSDGWPTAVPDQPHTQPLDRRRHIGGKHLTSPAGRGSVVDEKTKFLLAANKGKVSNAAMEGLKMALFYTALPDKAALTPIPTPPPSPPKNDGATSDLEASQATNVSSQRPPSTHSLPLMEGSYSSSSLQRSLPAPPSPYSLPSSPTAKVRHPRFGTPDAAVRLSNKDTSPRPYFSSDSDSDGDEDILRRTRNRRLSKNRRLSAQQLTSGMNSNRSSVSVSTFLSPNASPLHTSIRSTNSKTSKEEEERRKWNSDAGATCSGCGDYLPFILKDEPTKTGSLGDNVPIYYVLERPSMCQSCLQGNHSDGYSVKKNKTSVTSLPPALPPRDSSPLPPLPTLPLLYYPKESLSSSTDEDPVYETVISTSYKEEENVTDTDSKSRQLPPVAANLSRDSREFHTSSDYESIPSFEASMSGSGQDERKSFLRGQNGNLFHIHDNFGSSHASCHDYESISSLDYGHKFTTNTKSERVDLVHSYAKIPIKDDSKETDSPCQLPKDTSSSSIAQKSKLMKIDSHGYASVMSPGADDYLEQDCRQSDAVQPSSKGHHARDIEEAWKHQQERGYAALTLKTHPPTPPPLLSRTSSDGILFNSLSLVAPGSTPRDYEVPIPRHPPPPPLSIAKRKTSSPLQQKATFSPTKECQTFLSSEKEAALEPINNISNSPRKESDKQQRVKDDDGVDPNFLDMENDHHKDKHSAQHTSSGLAPHENPVPYTSQ